MGIFNEASSAISGKLGVKNYRTYVLNDFSVVAKAAFYTMKRDTSDPSHFNLIEKLPVQLNPSNLYETSSAVVTRGDGMLEAVLATKAKMAPPPKKSTELKSINIKLIYDIYDEYNVRTNNGLTALADDVSLTNPDFTSLPKLIECSYDNSMYALFRWGNLNFFGTIRKVGCSYDAFSCWGEPLKCEAEVDMLEYRLPDYTLGDNILDCFGTVTSQAISKPELAKKIEAETGLGVMKTTEEAAVLASLAFR